MKVFKSHPFACFLIAAGLVLELDSCVSTEREVSSSTVDPRTTYTPPPVSARGRIGSKTVLNTVTASHVFSDPKTKDRFVLQLRGPRVLAAQAHLIVVSSTGDTLRHEVLPARALLSHTGLQDAQSASVREQEIAILEGMNAFFADGRFTQPAIPAGTERPAEVDARTWSALREDPATVGFDYQGAGGGGRRIAYARRMGKIVNIGHQGFANQSN